MIYAEIAMSLDGFVAGPNGGPRNPLGDGGVKLHEWVFGLRSWRSRQGMAGGSPGPDDDLVRESFERTGAYVMGRRMFDEGEENWPEEAPFRAPVFVLTSRAREPWVRSGGTTFHFVTDGPDAALDAAREAAGDLDVRVAGGADTIRQAIRSGAVDELVLRVAPVLLGGGVSLFEGVPPGAWGLELLEAVGSARVAHLRYRVVR